MLPRAPLAMAHVMPREMKQRGPRRAALCEALTCLEAAGAARPGKVSKYRAVGRGRGELKQVIVGSGCRRGARLSPCVCAVLRGGWGQVGELRSTLRLSLTLRSPGLGLWLWHGAGWEGEAVPGSCGSGLVPRPRLCLVATWTWLSAGSESLSTKIMGPGQWVFPFGASWWSMRSDIPSLAAPSAELGTARVL